MSRVHEKQFYRQNGEDEIEVVVGYTITDYVPATYWQPAEGAEVEIVNATVDGKHVELTDDETDAWSIKIAQDHVFDDYDDADDWRDRMIDDRLTGAA